MYVARYVCLDGFLHVCSEVCMQRGGCLFLETKFRGCMYVCMYVAMYVFLHGFWHVCSEVCMQRGVVFLWRPVWMKCTMYACLQQSMYVARGLSFFWTQVWMRCSHVYSRVCMQQEVCLFLETIFDGLYVCTLPDTRNHLLYQLTM